ncbi:MAG: F0F1 ATP synthase subunit delta, partial [Nitrosospira sp.]|nr:F0F1 ATP synthase subunit delta [Nitrosospira sp.]
MAEARTIARPYAEAVFRLARNNGTLPAWSAMLQLATAMAVDESMRAIIG